MSTVSLNSRDEAPTGFAGFELAPELLRGIESAGFVEPRPIQYQAIPAALEGRDILGLAQTGTGKTAAFALPVLDRILAHDAEGGGRGRQKRGGPRTLVVAPTRELANQISEEIRLLARYTRVQVATVFGGVSASSQVAALRRRPEILVACPGRLLDLKRQGAVRLDDVEVLVLDEADHMFDMGFLPDVKRIVEALPDRRQNLLFSATMPPEIRRLANRVLRDPHVVELNHSRPVETVEHGLFPVDDNKRKMALLERVLAEDDFRSAIVFTRTKHRAKRLARQLDGKGHSAVALQGNMSQNARERAMSGFKSRQFRILVATDIAARGIDVEAVSHVVNFDMPTTPEAYTHRIGRTGRAERQGRAYTFVTPDDRDLVRAVERLIGAPLPHYAFDGTSRPASATTPSAARSGATPRKSGPAATSNPPSKSPRRRRRRGPRRNRSAASGRADGRPSA